MKKHLSIIVAVAILSLSQSTVFAGGSKAKPCPAGASCSENFILTDAQLSESLTATEQKKVKRIEMQKFSEILAKTPNAALFPLQKKAKEWLSRQNAETILGYSETVTCSRPGSCDGFITIIYWNMVSVQEEGKK